MEKGSNMFKLNLNLNIEHKKKESIGKSINENQQMKE